MIMSDHIMIDQDDQPLFSLVCKLFDEHGQVVPLQELQQRAEKRFHHNLNLLTLNDDRVTWDPRVSGNDIVLYRVEKGEISRKKRYYLK